MNNESQNIEYKESWRDDYLKWICGFANAQGGKIYIGVNDDREVVGVDDSKKLMEDIPNKIVNQLGIVCDVNLLQESEKDYIEIVVQPSPMPISFHGKYHYRSGSTKQELNGASLQQFILRKMGRSWDEYPRDSTTLDAIDRSSIDYFIEKGIASGRIDIDERNATTEQVLENLNLIDENGYLKNAALLLFAKKPQKFFSGVAFKIGKFGRDESELIVQDVVEGNLIEMPNKVIKLLKTFYLKAYIRYENMQRKEILEIPEDALREIIYNSVAHKDYTGADIQMRIYDDHIELWNEGELPEGYTQDTLFQKHSSKPRNKNIATAFFKAGYVEAWGRGYKKVKEALESVNLPFPKVENFCGGTLVTIQRPMGNSYENEQMSENTDSNVVKDVVKDVVKGIEMELSERQLSIIALLALNPTITIPEMSEKMSGKNSFTTRTIQRDIAYLQNHDIIKREGGRKEGRWVVLRSQSTSVS